ncbi:acyl-CoA dehydrogenase family protein [Roseomonas sp. CCTCC AB2023176]|uniref:acyl-CoA dehydrogenase family protein n=1 Tax=Roseomonas sp. CCTCC AB2023176 TaxID=3342640 RepID=UPI0035DE8B4D
MPDRDYLNWPFFDAFHRDWAAEVEAWAAAHAGPLSEGETDAATRALTRAMGEAGLLRKAVPEDGRLDVRCLCLARDILARHSGLADFAFAMAGLGTGTITLFGDAATRDTFLPAVREGRSLAAFALSEPEAGSDVAAIATTATRDGNAHWRLDGRKTWISNGGIADHYVTFARTGEGPGAKGLTAFVVPADAPGLSVEARIEVAAPHPLRRCASTVCASRTSTASADRARASRLPWPRSTCSARPSAPPRSASRGTGWTCCCSRRMRA